MSMQKFIQFLPPKVVAETVSKMAKSLDEGEHKISQQGEKIKRLEKALAESCGYIDQYQEQLAKLQLELLKHD